MNFSAARAVRATAVAGFLAVALGAFGAHGLKDILAQRPDALALWEKAVFYHLVHVAVMLFLTRLEPFPIRPWLLFGGGIIFFSGSLYLLALTGLRWFGFFTPPLGGLMFLAGWLWLALSKHNAIARASK